MRICLFDIDGTLISSGGAGSSAFEAALEAEFGIDITDHQVPYSGRTDRAIIGDMFSLYNVENTVDNWQRFHRAYLGLLPGSLESHDGTVLPGVANLLTLLASRNDVAIGLLTGNMIEGARLKLGYYGIADFFEFGGYGDRHLDRNDVAQEAIDVARDKLGDQFQAELVWVVGDTPLDISCARSVDAKVVAVATGLHDARQLTAASPDMVLSDLTEQELFLDAVLGL
ncbi:MAG: HAD hydrolase-like protein [Planctomycetales bacterium]